VLARIARRRPPLSTDEEKGEEKERVAKEVSDMI
jgi:hypothetical protein